MSRFLSFLLTLLAASATCLGGSLGFVSDGTMALDVFALTTTLNASLGLTYKAEGVSALATLEFDETGLLNLVLGAEAAFNAAGATCDVMARMAFDLGTASLAEGRLRISVTFDHLGLALESVRQDGGLGVMVDLAPPDGAFLESLSVGFNIDAFGQVETQSCELPFTHARADFAFSCACAEAGATVTFLATRFSELALSAANVGGLPLGIVFGARVVYTAGKKQLEIVPSLSLESPECFDLYAGIVWDEATSTLSGITLYGIGLACEVGAVRVRGLWELDSSAIALVKEPYWALLGLVWDIAGCCEEPGEASAALFFGEDGLFDVGAVELAFEWPTAPGCTAALTVAFDVAGGATITFGWLIEI